MSSPLFSLIIPTYNRPQALAACLKAISEMHSVSGGLEIIVVDDGSTCDLSDVIQRFRRNLPLITISQKNTGPAGARNLGAANASGRFIAFTDDDCRPVPDWLNCLAERLATAPNALVGGRTNNSLHGNPYSTASQMLLEYIYEYYQITHQDGAFFTSNNMALSRQQFLDIGGFDHKFMHVTNEDRELCERWRYHGLPLCYAPRAVVQHAHDLTLATFWRQHFNYGRGASRYHRVRSRYATEPISLEPMTFYGNMFRQPFRTNAVWPALKLASLLALSQISYFMGFVTERRR